jgi:predicted Zn finger-like uncharacterized protein
MLLACPHCATIYDVNRNVIGANGRSLRCARCETVWFATRSQELLLGPQRTADASAAGKPAPAAQENTVVSFPGAAGATDGELLEIPDPAATPPPSASGEYARSVATPGHVDDIESVARRRELEAAARARRLREQLGSPAIIAVLSLVVAFLIAWRTPIVQIAPQMASFYAAIGLPVNLRDLVFRDVKTFNETRDGIPLLTIEGTIASVGRSPVEVPRLRLALRDAARREIVSWIAAPDQSTLAPGKTLSFRSRLAAPPEQGHEVVVRFLQERDAAEGER